MAQVHLNYADLKAIQYVVDAHDLDEFTIRVAYEDSVSYLLAPDFVKDGGPCDWFNDTKPMVLEQLAKIKKDMKEEDGIKQQRG